ncbi:MAG TPA: hypothetical protein VM925_25605, partial [Labilithrix sp.]|nr:hypothetical protein [Labilithrix sp.]
MTAPPAAFAGWAMGERAHGSDNVTRLERRTPGPTHPYESSVESASIESPWTFATGGGSRSGSAAVAAAPFGSKLHFIAASALFLVSAAVLIASAVIARSP